MEPDDLLEGEEDGTFEDAVLEDMAELKEYASRIAEALEGLAEALSSIIQQN